MLIHLSTDRRLHTNQQVNVLTLLIFTLNCFCVITPVCTDLVLTMYNNAYTPPKSTPNKFIMFLITAVCLAVIISALYAFFIEPNWLAIRQMTVDARLDGPPLKLAQVSDLHLSSIGRLERNVIATLQKDPPDMILLTGDVIDNAASLDELDTFLSMLPTRPVKIAVLGNWEYWSGVRMHALMALYKKNNVHLLVNQCLTVQHITIMGLDDYTAGRPNYAAAKSLCRSTSPVIMIQHSPGFFGDQRYKADQGIILNLAGHTHGGQVTLFGSTLTTPEGSGSFDAGWFTTDWGTLFVSKGIGTSVLPIRFGARPEVVFFVIR